MQEFSAISVSTYSADGLAEKLTEASRDGWEVVSILNAGSNITAYLARPASETSASAPAPEEPGTGNGWEATPIEAVADEPVAVVSTPAIDEPPVVTPPVIEEPVAEQPAAVWAPEQPVVDTPADDLSGLENQFQPEPQPSLADDVAALVPQIGDEPAADATTETPSPFAPSLPGDQPAESVPASQPESQPEPDPAPEPEPAPVATATATASAPQGWYDDPSGRFQYRYWDGSQWTEHVSRDGQQYTDPPVA